MESVNRMNMANSFDPAAGEVNLDSVDRELLQRRQQVLGAPYRLFYKKPVHFVRGDGVLLFDKDGNDYLDAYNNVPVVGHSNPVVQARVAEQLGSLNTHTRYLADGVVTYAERLTGLFGSELNQAVFVCTGSEAGDLALRMASHVTGGTGYIVTRHAYHGTTQATAAVSPALGPNNKIPDHVEFVNAPDLARESSEAASSRFTQEVAQAIEQLKQHGHVPAALLIDSVMSSDGLQGTSPNLLSGAAEEIHKAGGLYIADEVQAGFGRTGQWWGFPLQGVSPDLVVLGKPMGNGVPLAGVVGKSEIFEHFGRDVRYFNTFGGSPVSIAAGGAVLDEIIERDLLSSVKAVGEEVHRELIDLEQSFQCVSAVRSTGLFFALEISDGSGQPDANAAAQVVNHMRENRVLISASGKDANVLKVRPPLVFGAEHVSRLISSLSDALATIR